MRHMGIIVALLAATIGLATVSGAIAEVLGPDPALTPEEVVSIQLNALKNNDDPAPNAGIAQTFALAHPANKRVTGPLPRFERMIRTPAYEPLLDHAAHRIERLGGNADAVGFKVTIARPNGDAVEYLWEVRRVMDGPDAGAWLTTRVSNPVPAGQAI